MTQIALQIPLGIIPRNLGGSAGIGFVSQKKWPAHGAHHNKWTVWLGLFFAFDTHSEYGLGHC